MNKLKDLIIIGIAIIAIFVIGSLRGVQLNKNDIKRLNFLVGPNPGMTQMINNELGASK